MKALLRFVGAVAAGFVVAAVLVMLTTFVASWFLVPGFRENPVAPPTGPHLVANVLGSFLAYRAWAEDLSHSPLLGDKGPELQRLIAEHFDNSGG